MGTPSNWHPLAQTTLGARVERGDVLSAHLCPSLFLLPRPADRIKAGCLGPEHILELSTMQGCSAQRPAPLVLLLVCLRFSGTEAVPGP